MTSRILAQVDSPRGRRAFLAAVAVTVFVFAVLAAHWRPLWYDELFTLYVAGEPSLAGTVRALLQGADTNPPLDYLLRHASMAWLGTSPEAFRWPSAAAFVAGLFAIYGYVRRRTGFFASAAAFVLPIGTAAAFFAFEGRAYALLFASAPIALLAWQRAVEAAHRPLRLLVLAAALCLGPFSHYYGVLNFVPVAAGEAWRTGRTRRVDWPIVATLAVACVATLGLVPFARTVKAMQGSFWAAGFKATDLVDYYRGFLEYGGMAAVAVAILLALIARGRSPRVALPAIPAHELVATVVLALTPVSAFVLATLVTGALTSKYAIALVPGIAILVGYLVSRAETSMRGAVAVLVAVFTVACIGSRVTAAMAFRGSEPVPADLRRILEASPWPVAFDSPHQFLEFVHYEPQLAAGRFFYPMDAATAREVRGFNNDEIALRGLARIRPLNVADYREFGDGHPTFLVLSTTMFWPGLTKALQRDGHCLVAVASVGSTTVLRASRGPCGDADD